MSLCIRNEAVAVFRDALPSVSKPAVETWDGKIGIPAIVPDANSRITFIKRVQRNWIRRTVVWKFYVIHGNWKRLGHFVVAVKIQAHGKKRTILVDSILATGATYRSTRSAWRTSRHNLYRDKVLRVGSINVSERVRLFRRGPNFARLPW